MNDLRPGVVTVFAGGGHGSGFFLTRDGYLLTNEHVVREAKYVKVRLITGREVVGEVLRTDSRGDVALIKVEEAGMNALPIRTDEPAVGEDVYAIGTPLEPKLSTTVSRGIVSAYRAEDGQKLIQSDVTILPGNSGGPLLDRNGNVVGIAVSGRVYGRGMAGINFFIPITDALAALSLQ
jgi:S1-C subfamily serine protease